jgi:large subunit ribosomal protein L24
MKTKKPGKSRKRRAEAPLHKKQKMAGAHLGKSLRDKYKRRGLAVRKGDVVKIMRGKDKGKEGKVETVMIGTGRVYIKGIKMKKNDGSEKPRPIDASNLEIIEIDLSDKERINKIERGRE